MTHAAHPLRRTFSRTAPMSLPASHIVRPLALTSILLTAGALTGCASTGGASEGDASSAALQLEPPVPGAVLANDLIQPGETRFKNLWRLTFGGQNAEAYWNYADDGLSLQLRETNARDDCDQIFVTSPSGDLRQVSTGRGVTTCAFYMPDDQAVLYASTQSGHVA